jgi:hypothetical protein
MRFSGGKLRFVSCHAPNNTYVSSTPMANAKKGTTVTCKKFGVIVDQGSPQGQKSKKNLELLRLESALNRNKNAEVKVWSYYPPRRSKIFQKIFIFDTGVTPLIHNSSKSFFICLNMISNLADIWHPKEEQ